MLSQAFHSAFQPSRTPEPLSFRLPGRFATQRCTRRVVPRDEFLGRGVIDTTKQKAVMWFNIARLCASPTPHYPSHYPHRCGQARVPQSQRESDPQLRAGTFHPRAPLLVVTLYMILHMYSVPYLPMRLITPMTFLVRWQGSSRCVASPLSHVAHLWPVPGCVPTFVPSSTYS